MAATTGATGTAINDELLPFRVTVPGKVIISGEHSVVYGKLALAASISLSTEALFASHTNDSVKISCPNLDLLHEVSLTSLDQLFAFKSSFVSLSPQEIAKKLEKCLSLSSENPSLVVFFYLYVLALERPIPFQVTLQSSLPIGAGLGSSASFCVSLGAGLFVLSKPGSTVTLSSLDLQHINDLGFKGEQIIHGNPSGIDNTVCTFGQLVAFRKDGYRQPFPINTLRVLLVNTKVPRETKQLVGRVRENLEKNPEAIGAILDNMDGLTGAIRTSLESSDTCFEKLRELLYANHVLLSELGVSHPRLDRIVSIAKQFDVGAKLTGAGGGGLAFVIFPSTFNAKPVIELLESEGFECWETGLGSPGVTVVKAE